MLRRYSSWHTGRVTFLHALRSHRSIRSSAPSKVGGAGTATKNRKSSDAAASHDNSVVILSDLSRKEGSPRQDEAAPARESRPAAQESVANFRRLGSVAHNLPSLPHVCDSDGLLNLAKHSTGALPSLLPVEVTSPKVTSRLYSDALTRCWSDGLLAEAQLLVQAGREIGSPSTLATALTHQTNSLGSDVLDSVTGTVAQPPSSSLPADKLEKVSIIGQNSDTASQALVVGAWSGMDADDVAALASEVFSPRGLEAVSVTTAAAATAGALNALDLHTAFQLWPQREKRSRSSHEEGERSCFGDPSVTSRGRDPCRLGLPAPARERSRMVEVRSEGREVRPSPYASAIVSVSLGKSKDADTRYGWLGACLGDAVRKIGSARGRHVSEVSAHASSTPYGSQQSTTAGTSSEPIGCNPSSLPPPAVPTLLQQIVCGAPFPASGVLPLYRAVLCSPDPADSESLRELVDAIVGSQAVNAAALATHLQAAVATYRRAAALTAVSTARLHVSRAAHAGLPAASAQSSSESSESDEELTHSNAADGALHSRGDDECRGDDEGSVSESGSSGQAVRMSKEEFDDRRSQLSSQLNGLSHALPFITLTTLVEGAGMRRRILSAPTARNVIGSMTWMTPDSGEGGGSVPSVSMCDEVLCFVRDVLAAAPLPPAVYNILLRSAVVNDDPDAACALLAHAAAGISMVRGLQDCLREEQTESQGVEDGEAEYRRLCLEDNALPSLLTIEAAASGALPPHKAAAVALSLLRAVAPGGCAMAYSDVRADTLQLAGRMFARHGMGAACLHAYRWHLRAIDEAGANYDAALRSAAASRSLQAIKPSADLQFVFPAACSSLNDLDQLVSSPVPDPVVVDIRSPMGSTVDSSSSSSLSDSVAARFHASLFDAAHCYRRTLATACQLSPPSPPLFSTVLRKRYLGGAPSLTLAATGCAIRTSSLLLGSNAAALAMAASSEWLQAAMRGTLSSFPSSNRATVPPVSPVSQLPTLLQIGYAFTVAETGLSSKIIPPVKVETKSSETQSDKQARLGSPGISFPSTGWIDSLSPRERAVMPLAEPLLADCAIHSLSILGAHQDALAVWHSISTNQPVPETAQLAVSLRYRSLPTPTMPTKPSYDLNRTERIRADAAAASSPSPSVPQVTVRGFDNLQARMALMASSWYNAYGGFAASGATSSHASAGGGARGRGDADSLLPHLTSALGSSREGWLFGWSAALQSYGHVSTLPCQTRVSASSAVTGGGGGKSGLLESPSPVPPHGYGSWSMVLPPGRRWDLLRSLDSEDQPSTGAGLPPAASSDQLTLSWDGACLPSVAHSAVARPDLEALHAVRALLAPAAAPGSGSVASSRRLLSLPGMAGALCATLGRACIPSTGGHTYSAPDAHTLWGLIQDIRRIAAGTGGGVLLRHGAGGRAEGGPTSPTTSPAPSFSSSSSSSVHQGRGGAGARLGELRSRALADGLWGAAMRIFVQPPAAHGARKVFQRQQAIYALRASLAAAAVGMANLTPSLLPPSMAHFPALPADFSFLRDPSPSSGDLAWTLQHMAEAGLPLPRDALCTAPLASLGLEADAFLRDASALLPGSSSVVGDPRVAPKGGEPDEGSPLPSLALTLARVRRIILDDDTGAGAAVSHVQSALSSGSKDRRSNGVHGPAIPLLSADALTPPTATEAAELVTRHARLMRAFAHLGRLAKAVNDVAGRGWLPSRAAGSLTGAAAAFPFGTTFSPPAFQSSSPVDRAPYATFVQLVTGSTSASAPSPIFFSSVPQSQVTALGAWTVYSLLLGAQDLKARVLLFGSKAAEEAARISSSPSKGAASSSGIRSLASTPVMDAEIRRLRRLRSESYALSSKISDAAWHMYASVCAALAKGKAGAKSDGGGGGQAENSLQCAMATLDVHRTAMAMSLGLLPVRQRQQFSTSTDMSGASSSSAAAVSSQDQSGFCADLSVVAPLPDHRQSDLVWRSLGHAADAFCNAHALDSPSLSLGETVAWDFELLASSFASAVSSFGRQGLIWDHLPSVDPFARALRLVMLRGIQLSPQAVADSLTYCGSREHVMASFMLLHNGMAQLKEVCGVTSSVATSSGLNGGGSSRADAPAAPQPQAVESLLARLQWPPAAVTTAASCSPAATVTFPPPSPPLGPHVSWAMTADDGKVVSAKDASAWAAAVAASRCGSVAHNAITRQLDALAAGAVLGSVSHEPSLTPAAVQARQRLGSAVSAALTASTGNLIVVAPYFLWAAIQLQLPLSVPAWDAAALWIRKFDQTALVPALLHLHAQAVDTVANKGGRSLPARSSALWDLCAAASGAGQKDLHDGLQKLLTGL